jgi:hypothetical protein
MHRIRVCALLLAALFLTGSLAMAQRDAPDGAGAATAAEALVDQLATGDFTTAESRFDERMRAALPETKLRAAWAQISAQAGAYQRRGTARVEDATAQTIAVVPAEFENATLDVRVTLDGAGRVAGLFFAPHVDAAGAAKPVAPPPYADRSHFTERAMTVGEGEWALPATLTLPRGVASAPAVVLVHGSGPQDRDETVGGVRPFRDLAWGLASRGIAVLRYEKRTRAHAAAAAARLDGFTVRDETTDDAIAAVRLLRATAGADAAHVYLLGHSLGGMLAPRIALEDRDIAGLVIMAGTTRPLEQVIVAQADYLASIGAVSAEQLAPLREGAAQVAALTPADSTRPGLIMGAPASYWLDLRSYSPAATAHALARPMLILQGGRDYQVTAEDYEAWKAALEGRSDVTFHLYPALNHLFVAGEGASRPSEYLTPAHVAPDVVADIASWVSARAARRP